MASVLTIFFLGMVDTEVINRCAGSQDDNRGDFFRQYLILSFWKLEVIVCFFRYCMTIEVLVNNTVFPSYRSAKSSAKFPKCL